MRKLLQVYIPEKDAGQFEKQLRGIREIVAARNEDPLEVPSKSEIIRQAVERWYEDLKKGRH